MNQKIKHKYHAKRCESDNIKFHSKAERRFYHELLLRQKAGEVIFFMMQCPFHLPGGVRYYVDFVVYEADGSVRFIDVKGYVTEAFKIKKKLVEDSYPVEIEVIKM